MVEAAFARLQQLSGVLAAIPITLANSPGAEFGTAPWHLGEVHGHNHGGHPDRAAHGLHRVIGGADGQSDPFLPGHGPDVAFAFDLEGGGDIGGHLAKGIGRRANVDRLPVAIQHQHDRFV